MNPSFLKNCVIFKFIIFYFQVFSVAYGEVVSLSEKEILSHNGNLQDKKDFNENNYMTINESSFRKSDESKNVEKSSYWFLNVPHLPIIVATSNSIPEVFSVAYGEVVSLSEKSENVEKSSWFLNVPLLPIIVATSNSIPESSCKRQLRLYFNHLKNGTLWATEMFDSSAKYPYGLIDGHTRHLGSFDQCVRIQTSVVNKNDGKIEEIRSRYCLVDVEYKEKVEPKNFTGEHELIFNPQSSAWEAIKVYKVALSIKTQKKQKEKGDFRRFRRYLLQMALCFPADCHPEDIVAALKEPLEKFGSQYNLEIKASILPLYCSSTSQEAPELSNYDKIYCFVFFTIIALVIISTIIDKNSNHDEELCLSRELLSCFSARKSINEIFTVVYGHRGFNCIDFFRVFLTSIAVLDHRHLQYMYAGTITGLNFERLVASYTFGLMLNSAILVDGFFGIGGLLMAYSFLEDLNISKKFNFLLLIVKRLVRVTPLYIFLTFGYATIFHRLGSGPFWESSVGFDRDSCSSYWWANLFFINNYVGGENKCLLQSWYLSVDLHSYIIGLFLLGAFNKMSRKIGYLFLGWTLIVSSAIPFYVIYKNDLDPIFKSVTYPRRFEENEFLVNYYVKTHMRISAYIVGLIVGTFIYDYKNATWRLSKSWSQILFLISVFIIMIATAWVGVIFMDPNVKTSAFIRALYASLHRPLFAFGVCSIPLLFTIGDGLDFHYKLLTPGWVQPISRISYGIYLTHFIIHHYELGTTRTVFTFSIYNSVKYLVTDMVYSMCLALFFVVLIELPFKNFGNLLLKRKTNLMISRRSSNSRKKTE